MHEFLQIGSLSLPMYGLCTMVGTVFALLAVFKLRKKGSPISEDNLLDALIWAIVLGFVCSKLLYFIVDPPQMPHSWADVWELISRGLVFYGGLIGGLLGLVFVSRKTTKHILTYTDLMAPCFCLAHAGGRVGCLMAGCCYGMPYTGPCAVVLGGVSRLPTQLMEAVFLVILSAGLIALFLKKPRRGAVTGWYMTLYAVWRFIIEFFRADERGSVGPLSTSQFISLFIFALGVYLLVRSRKEVNDFEQASKKKVEEPVVERPETAALPIDPMEMVDAPELPEEEKRENPPELGTMTDESAPEVSGTGTAEVTGTAELGGETGGGDGGDGGGPGDGGDQ